MDADGHRDRLWTPWRMRYIGGGAREDGCVFCNRLAGGDDVASLIVHRGEHAFAILNLYPYNTGHVMIVPNAHVAGIDDVDDDALVEMARMLPAIVRALRRVLACDGFNMGINQGSIAGAGIAAHLHQHVVPRWEGDANFMPIIGRTMVLPELIPATYAKIRAELDAEVHGAATFSVALLDTGDGIWLHHGHLPTIPRPDDGPVWRAAVAATACTDLALIDYAGPPNSRDRAVVPCLVFRSDRTPTGEGWTRYPLAADQKDPATRFAIGLVRDRVASQG